MCVSHMNSSRYVDGRSGDTVLKHDFMSQGHVATAPQGRPDAARGFDVTTCLHGRYRQRALRGNEMFIAPSQVLRMAAVTLGVIVLMRLF